MIRKLKIISAIFVAFCVAYILAPESVHAAASKSDLVSKAYANGLGICSNSVFFKPEISASNVRGFDSLIEGYNFGTINTPNGLEGGNASAIDCSKLFNEHFSSKTGSFPSYENPTGLDIALKSIGYQNGESSGQGRCISINYRLASDASNAVRTTESICFNVSSDGTISASDIEARNDYPDSSKDVSLAFGGCLNNPAEKCVLIRYGGETYDAGTQSFSPLRNNNSWTNLVNDVNTAVNNIGTAVSRDGNSRLYTNVEANQTSGGGQTYTYGLTNNTENANKVVNYFAGYDSWDAAKFNTTEQYWFYVYTLTDFYGARVDATGCSASPTSGAIAVRNEKGERRYCKVSDATNLNAGTVNIFNPGESHYLNRKGNLSDVIAALQNADGVATSDLLEVNEGTGTVTDPGVVSPENPTDSSDTTGGDSSNDVCYGADGTLGMSWLVCPIATGLYDTLGSVYGVVENNFLKLDGPKLLNSDTYSVWQTFQSIANILFVIFLLVVIFSQLTGYGIDNYGIKKILPRLIICAILINLSFLIVQAAVDVSNIVGAGAKGVFTNITPPVNSGATDASGAAVATATIVGLGITIGAFVWNPALLLSFLLGLLSCVISVITLWVILMAREVGVVIIAIIAPLAFACYLLPNTSRWLKSWWNVLKALLLLYPLAAFLVGGSAFVSAIIANTATGDDRISNNLIMLGAMLVRFLPFFALPGLFKKTLDAVGKLGTTIQGLGRGLGQGATRGLQGSAGYKTAQQRAQEYQARRRAGYSADGSERKDIFARARKRIDDSAVGRTLGWQRNRRSATEAYLKAQNERQRDEYLRNQDNVAATLIGQESKWEKEQVDNQSVLLDKGMMTSAIAGRDKVSDTPQSIREELVERLSRSAEEQAAHYAENAALWKKLQSFKDKGYDETAKLWDDSRITDSNSRLMQEIKADVTANGDFKNGARTAYDIISGSAPRTIGAIELARATGASLNNLKMERLPDFSGAELSALSSVAQGKQYTDASGTVHVPSAAAQLQASELLYNALSDSQVARRFKGADADTARAGARLAFEANFGKTNHAKDDNVSYVKRDQNGNITERLNYKRTAQGFIYDPSTNRMVDEASLIRNGGGYERES